MTSRTQGTIALVLTLAGFAGAGCKERPLEPPSGEDALGPAVVGRPYVTHWSSGDRIDLAHALGQGVAVVSYDGTKLTVLDACRVRGTYQWFPVPTPEEQVVNFSSALEAKLNMPPSASGGQVAVEAAFRKGNQLEVGVVMVGKLTTTWNRVRSSDLDGACDGATHFVRAATLGAFVMESSAERRVRAVASMFQAAAGVAGEKSSSLYNRAGEYDACEVGASTDEPPENCSAPIRIDLIAITDEPNATASSADAESTAACPSGFSMSAGRCVESSTSALHECAPEQPKDCIVQCERGDGASCNRLGIIAYSGAGLEADPIRARQSFTRACELSHPEGCVNLGRARMYGIGGDVDAASAVNAWIEACQSANGAGCRLLGDVAYAGEIMTRDLETAVKAYDAGCRLGDFDACNTLGLLRLGGEGLAPDFAAAKQLFAHACDGGSTAACYNLGYQADLGLGGAEDLDLAGRAYERACSLHDMGCMCMGIAAQMGRGAARSDARAIEYFGRSCSAGYPAACAVLKVLTDVGGAVAVPTEGMEDQYRSWDVHCDAGVARECAELGITLLAVGQVEPGRARLHVGCERGDPWACEIEARVQRLLSAP
jgi:TPR repeat protein